jgi:hypothetical protein
VIGWLVLLLSVAAVEPGGRRSFDLRVPESPAVGADADTTVARSIDPLPSLMAPPAPRDLTRVETRWRPFLGFVGNSWGAIGEVRIEHYFKKPFMLGVELSPVAFASSGDGVGAATHVRAVGALVTKHLSLGLGVGAKVQRYGSSGMSVAPSVRLGSIDGLNLYLTYTHAIAPNKYTNKLTTGFSNALARLQVPVTRGLALELDAGVSLDTWGFATLGLRQRVFGNGGPGTLYISGGFGLAMVVDKSPCNYNNTYPCGSSATSYGPTVSAGLEYRF